MPNEQKYTDIEGQAQPLTQLASASQQSIKTKQKCCTGYSTTVLHCTEIIYYRNSSVGLVHRKDQPLGNLHPSSLTNTLHKTIYV